MSLEDLSDSQFDAAIETLLLPWRGERTVLLWSVESGLSSNCTPDQREKTLALVKAAFDAGCLSVLDNPPNNKN